MGSPRAADASSSCSSEGGAEECALPWDDVPIRVSRGTPGRVLLEIGGAPAFEPAGRASLPLSARSSLTPSGRGTPLPSPVRGCAAETGDAPSSPLVGAARLAAALADTPCRPGRRAKTPACLRLSLGESVTLGGLVGLDSIGDVPEAASDHAENDAESDGAEDLDAHSDTPNGAEPKREHACGHPACDKIVPILRSDETHGDPKKADACRPRLPHKRGVRDAIPRISSETLIGALAGRLPEGIARVVVFDCRFAYEFAGGHIPGARNVCALPDALDALFDENCAPKLPPGTALVFHCEFSSERAPRMALSVRSLDRRANAASYPALHYPELYVLDGGYRAFHAAHPLACRPPHGYVPMRSVANAGDLALSRRLRATGASAALLLDLALAAPPTGPVVLSSDACEDVRDCGDEIMAAAHAAFL